ncbi:hypothetical protein Zmor_008286 [Zophobas morio]|uniref:Uncharacterized protein n=1 Tax=Zophobas morio TaxID=2755281 RepID=A0AA38MQQ4_9CUCU|nr:hypothetical protein Zmor_008286 [Zophobas morio]
MYWRAELPLVSDVMLTLLHSTNGCARMVVPHQPNHWKKTPLGPGSSQGHVTGEICKKRHVFRPVLIDGGSFGFGEARVIFFS